MAAFHGGSYCAAQTNSMDIRMTLIVVTLSAYTIICAGILGYAAFGADD